jgi:hypothetical protein
LGYISDRDCHADLDRNVEEGLITSGWEGNSYRLKPGNYWVNGSLVYLRTDLDKGFCCARRAFLGKPCPRSAGICQDIEETLAMAYASNKGCIDSIPKIWIESDTVFVQVCGNTYNIAIPTTTVTDTIITICEGDSLQWNGEWLKTPGTYSKNYETERGDSIVYLNLDVLQKKSSTNFHMINQGDTISFGNHMITTAGTYTDTLTASNGCDSISILQVLLKEEPVDPCTEKDSIWRQAGGVFGEFFAHNSTKTGWGGQELIKLNSWQFAARLGYEKRLRNNSLLFNKKDCWGESFKVYALAHTTPMTFIADDCHCNNLSQNSFWTVGVGSEYRVHWYRQYPFIFSVGIGGEFLYNKTEADENLSETKNTQIDIFVSPKVDYLLTNGDRMNLSIFIESPIRILQNPNRGLGINGGIRIGF